jgi:hypothetical protein
MKWVAQSEAVEFRWMLPWHAQEATPLLAIWSNGRRNDRGGSVNRRYTFMGCCRPFAAQVHHGGFVLWRTCSVRSVRSLLEAGHEVAAVDVARNERGQSARQNRRREREQRVITSRSGALQNRTEGNPPSLGGSGAAGEGNEDFSDNVLEPILVFLVIFCFNLQKQRAARP